MRRGTTPALLLTIPGRDLRNCTIKVTVKRKKGEMLTKTNDSIVVAYESPDTTLAVRFTQEDTLSLHEGTAEIQVRWIDSTGYAGATETKNVEISKILLDEVIAYAE